MEKYYNSTSSLVMGIVLTILSIVLLVGKNEVYRAIVHLIILLFFIRFLFDIIYLFFKRKEVDKRKELFISMLFHLGTCLIFLIIPNLFYGFVPVLFSLYLSLIGVVQFVMCCLEIKNGGRSIVSQFFIGVISFFIAIPILINPVMKLDTFIICIGIYTLLLGFYYLYDFIVFIVPIRAKNRLKRRIRITLPKIVEAIIPYSVMVDINRNLEVRKTVSYASLKANRASDLDILVHTSNRGFNKMGHIDIFFEGKVISYGNYDEGSRFFRQFFGDGVLFIAKSKEKYINFCIDNSKKTVFDFGILLTEVQKNRIRQRIDELCANTVKWNHKTDKYYNNGNSYAGRLYKKTKAKFYKFKKGKYRTYFVMGTNCCYLADDILGKSGMDILSINGIITPGTYYDYLNRELKQKNSNVISKAVYNFENRAEE